MDEPTTTPHPSITRRRVLGGAAVIGAGLVAAACGSDSNDANSPVNSTGSSAGSQAPDTTSEATTDTTAQDTAPQDTAPETTAAGEEDINLQIAGLAAGLEVLAVQTYAAALDAAGAGDLGEVPPAVAEFVTVAMAQHQEQLDAWNAVLSGAGAEEVTEPNAELKPTVDAAFAEVTDVVGAAELALMLEEIAAATYLSAQEVLTDKDAIMLAGSIQIIDAQHAAILYYVLGEYPVPDVFAKTELSAA